MKMHQTVSVEAMIPDVGAEAFSAPHPSVAEDATLRYGGSRYRPTGRPRILSFGIVLALHVGVLCLLRTMTHIDIKRLHSVPLVMDLLPLDQPPPAQNPPAAKKREPELPRRSVPQIVAPPPLVHTPVAAPPVTTVAVSPPPTPAIVVENPEPAASSEPVASDNLALKLISANPPTYPVASRRNREQGVVLLELVVGIDGRVEEISVRRSSGFENLDRAALAAVRRWRWSPTVINQQAVRVRGVVRIPFELRS